LLLRVQVGVAAGGEFLQKRNGTLPYICPVSFLTCLLFCVLCRWVNQLEEEFCLLLNCLLCCMLLNMQVGESAGGGVLQATQRHMAIYPFCIYHPQLPVVLYVVQVGEAAGGGVLQQHNGTWPDIRCVFIFNCLLFCMLCRWVNQLEEEFFRQGNCTTSGTTVMLKCLLLTACCAECCAAARAGGRTSWRESSSGRTLSGIIVMLNCLLLNRLLLCILCF
jgi:hypothetical protein